MGRILDNGKLDNGIFRWEWNFYSFHAVSGGKPRAATHTHLAAMGSVDKYARIPHNLPQCSLIPSIQLKSQLHIARQPFCGSRTAWRIERQCQLCLWYSGEIDSVTATVHICGCNFAPNTKMMSAWNLCRIIFVTLSILRDSSCLNSTNNGLSEVMDTIEWKAMVNLNNQTALIGRGWREPLSADMSFVFD